MKLVCPREELSKGLQVVLRSVGARAGIPALSGVLMELGDQDLTLTTTDLELTTQAKVAITGETGKTVVPARLLAEIVRNLPSEEVELVVENGTVRVGGGRAQFQLRSLPAEDFPSVQAAEDTRTLTIPAEVLSEALGQVSPAASRDETRPVLTGVLFEGDGDVLSLVATDSYRLAVRELKVPGSGDVRFLVPARAMVEVARQGATGEIRIEVAPSQVAFHLGDVVIQSRLIEGEFPAYKQLLPDDQPNRCTVTQEPFLGALKRIAVLARDATPVFVEFEENLVRFSCQSQGVGDAVEEVDAGYTGETMRVAFNPTYLEAGVDASPGETVEIDLSEPQRPALIHGSGDTDFRYLLMPIRVS